MYTMSDARIPTADLLADLRAVAEAVDRTPRVADAHEHSTYSFATFRRRCGGMAEALDATESPF